MPNRAAARSRSAFTACNQLSMRTPCQWIRLPSCVEELPTWRDDIVGRHLESIKDKRGGPYQGPSCRSGSAGVAIYYRYGTENSEVLRTNSTIMPCRQQSERQKEKDRSFVRDIPKILAKAGDALLEAHG